MSSRAARKLLKENEAKLIATKVESEEESPVNTGNKKVNGFGAFAMSDSESDHESNSEVKESKIQEEVKEKGNTKKAKKPKNKKIDKVSKDSFDDAIAEFQKNSKSNPIQDEEFKSNVNETPSCLSINPKNLNYTKELQRYFKDAKLVETQKGEKQSKRGYVLQKFKTKKRLVLVHNDESLFPLSHKLECSEIGVNSMSEKEFAFTPTPKYAGLQETYEGLKNTHDPQNIFDFLGMNPGHIDALYDISEYFRLKGDYVQANGLLERILYVYESSFSPEFSSILHKPHSQVTLSYNDKYSKTFFLSLHRFAEILGRKSCFKAAMEFNKLLLKLSPQNDPLGALLSFDYYAISARYYSSFIDFVATFSEEIYKSKRHSISLLPNIAYSLALAKFLTKFETKAEMKEIIDIDMDVGNVLKRAEDLGTFVRESDCTSQLALAIVMHPYFLKSIAIANDYLKQDISHSCLASLKATTFASLFESNFFKLVNLFQDDAETQEKLAELYTDKSKILWKQNEVKVWVKGVATMVLNQLQSNESLKKEVASSLDILESKLPFKLSRYAGLSRKHFSDTEAVDFANIEDNGRVQHQQPRNPINPNQNLLSLLLGSLMPWNDVPQEFENNERIGE